MAGRLRPQTARTARDDDTDSIASFQSSPSPTKASLRYQSWTGNQQIDHDNYHKMLEEYRAAKQKQQGDELKIKQLAAQLARTEEAAKRALIKADQGAKGSTAQQLLDAQSQIQQLQADNSNLSMKLAREKKRAAELRASAEDYRRRMEAALKEQRQLVRKLGAAEHSLGGTTAARTAARKAAAEQEFWSEEAGRRFAAQQDELVALRDTNEQLQHQLAAAVPADTASRYEATIKELQQMVHFYERRLAQADLGSDSSCGLQDAAIAGGQCGAGAAGACGRWLLEATVEGGACYLWEPSSGRVFSDPPEGQWPRPVGLKYPDAAGGIHLGVRGRLDAAFRALADLTQNGSSFTPGSTAHNGSSSTDSQAGAAATSGNNSSTVLARSLSDALRQLLTRSQPGRCANSCSSLAHAAAGGAGIVDVRDLPALLSVMLPGIAHKEAAELAAWLRCGLQQQQQDMGSPVALTLHEVEAAVKGLLEARDAVRQGRDLAVNEALLRVRRLLRAELQAVMALSEAVEGQDGCCSTLQVVQLLQHEQLLPDLTAAEAHHLLMLLHEWDLSGTARHSLTDVYVCLQLLALVRVASGVLSGQGQGHGHTPPSGLQPPPDRPDSRQSTATASSLTTNSTTVPNKAAAGAGDGTAGLGRQANRQQGKHSKRGAIGAAWEGLGSGSGAAGSGPGGVGGGSSGSRGGVTLKEVYLKERVAALEAELSHARAGAGAVSSKEVDQLRAEVARYQARLAELENDFLSLDVVANTEVTEYDAELRKAWFTAAAFKKRYVEHKLELDAIKETAEKMQSALDDTHRALHAEAASRMALEEVVTVAKMEAARSKELVATLAAERAERLKLEKDYLELQSKAFAAPGSALAEVRQLREELLAARRDRAVGEAREAELRRELSSLKRQLEGVSPEEHRRLVRELAEKERHCTTMELELRAALDKLEVYRRADDAAAASAPPPAVAPATATSATASLSQQPDEDKSVEELRIELEQLRQAMALQGEETLKLHKLLDTEASISLEAKAALEEAQAALAAAKAQATQQLAMLRRDVDHREEKIRKLEQQLHTAYGSLGRAALRASGAPDLSGSVRISRVGLAAAHAPVAESMDETIEALAPHENLIEVLVSEASLSPAAGLSPDASTFVAWDFFLHDSQATPVCPGTTPGYNTTVRYVVEADAFLLEYLSKQQLSLEVFEARGWDVRGLGVAHLPLQALLQDLEVGAALGNKRAWHHVDIVGSNGQQLGRIRVGFKVAKPIDKLLLAQHLQQQQQQQSLGSGDDEPRQDKGQQQATGLEVAAPADAAALALQQAADQADANPSKASHLLVTIHRCEGLQQQQHQQQGLCVPAQRPYVHYSPPGRSVAHDTCLGAGPAPVFEDAASWRLVKSSTLMEALQQHNLQVAVFDDAVADPSSALLGLASVPLAPLAEGVPVQGPYSLMQPSTGQPAGTVWLSIAWHDPLATAALGTRLLTARLPLTGTTAAAAVGDGGDGNAVEQPAAATATPAADAAGLGVGGDPVLWALQAQLQQLQLQLQQHQQHQQQQQQPQQQPMWPQVMQGPQLLPAVPMVLNSPQQQQPCMPGISPAAAAAVTAALGSSQQQQHTLLLSNTAPPGDPTSPFRPAAIGAGNQHSVLVQQQQPQQQWLCTPTKATATGSVGGCGFNLRYGPPTGSIQQQSPPHPSVLLSQPAATGPSRQPALQQPFLLQHQPQQSLVQYAQQPQQQQPQQQQPPGGCDDSSPGAEQPAEVLQRVGVSAEGWVQPDTTIYLRVEGLSLSGDALADPAVVGRHVLLAHMLLEDFTSPVQQCTETALADGPSFLSYSYAVAYSVADPVTRAPTAAGRALAAALAEADAGAAPRLVLPVLLACSSTPIVTDFSQVDCVASCELQLSDIWQGLSGDIISREFSLVPAAERAAAYPCGSVGQLRLTLVAARALRTLLEACSSSSS